MFIFKGSDEGDMLIVFMCLWNFVISGLLVKGG